MFTWPEAHATPLKRRHPFRNKEICFILFYKLLVPAQRTTQAQIVSLVKSLQSVQGLRSTNTISGGDQLISLGAQGRSSYPENYRRWCLQWKRRARLINIIDHNKIMSGMLNTIIRKERLGTSMSPEFLCGFCTWWWASPASGALHICGTRKTLPHKPKYQSLARSSSVTISSIGVQITEREACIP